MRKKIHLTVRTVLIALSYIVLLPIYIITYLLLVTIAVPFNYVFSNPENDYRLDKGSLFISTILLLIVLALFVPVIAFSYRDAFFTIAQESLEEFIFLKDIFTIAYTALWVYILCYFLAIITLNNYNVSNPKWLFTKHLFKE